MTQYGFKNVLLADRVYEKLESDIIFGKYARGQVLTELGLAEELGVSRTPIREALKRLAQERLITDGTTGKGCIVLGITEKDVKDIMNIRCRLESLASRYAAENATPEDLARLKHIVELQEFYTEKGDAAHVKEMDDQFHVEICRIGDSQILADTLIPLHMRIQKYRRASFDQPKRREEVSREHREIYEAIAAGDGELAEKVTEKHVNHAADRITGGENK